MFCFFCALCVIRGQNILLLPWLLSVFICVHLWIIYMPVLDIDHQTITVFAENTVFVIARVSGLDSI